MTLLELVQALQRESGSGDSTLSTVVSATGETLRLKNWIIEAYAWVQSECSDWKFLWTEAAAPITTAVGVSDYVGADDLATWDRASFRIDGELLSEDCVRDFSRSEFPTQAASGLPTEIWILPNNQIRLYPTPDAGYDIDYDYWATPDVLDDSNGATPIIPTRFHRLLWIKALEFYATYENADEIMAKFQRLWTEWWPKFEADQKPGHEAGVRSNGNFLQVIAE